MSMSLRRRAASALTVFTAAVCACATAYGHPSDGVGYALTDDGSPKAQGTSWLPRFGAAQPFLAPLSTTAVAAGTDGVRFGPREAVRQRACQPDDRPETGLQGHVPPTDVASGRAAQGYTCNLELVGQFRSTAAATLDTFEDCAYYGRQLAAGGVQVLDVSDSTTPKPTGELVSPAMQDPWESMRVNVRRKLLVAGNERAKGTSNLDIYDLSADCRRPRLISSTDMRPAYAHEGWFSPDGMTYYMSTTGEDGAASVFPVDISDPAHPRLLASWGFDAQTHGGSTTEDGTRTYICRQSTPPTDALLVVDTSEVAIRKAGPRSTLLATVPLGDNQWCQGAYRVTYDGHPYLIQYGERSGAADCSRSRDNWATFGYPRIFDLADERNPVLVSTALLEVHLPQNCSEVTNQGAVNGLGYSVHHCSPDRLYDPTILACSWFHGGMRVLDIRDPRDPVEIGYFNPGLNGALGTAARPVVRADRREIWFVNDLGGFHAVRFKKGIWPFEDAASCPEFDDYFFAHYNRGSDCATATLGGIGKPAPGGRRCTPGGLPRARFARGGVRLTRRGIRVRGTATAEACGTRVDRVVVSVARVGRAARCRYLRPRGRLGAGERCSRPRFLPAQGAESFSFRASARLPRGRYRVGVRALDSNGVSGEARFRRATVR